MKKPNEIIEKLINLLLYEAGENFSGLYIKSVIYQHDNQPAKIKQMIFGWIDGQLIRKGHPFTETKEKYEAIIVELKAALKKEKKESIKKNPELF